MTDDTICAISTAPGMGAISIIRVSGEKSITILDEIFFSVKEGRRLCDSKTHRAHFGQIRSAKNEIIDEVLVTVFIAPHSFTGENSVEIACHGSQYIQQQIMQLLLEHGCRMARPGEYTQRAFLNGRMDLSQAEAVADLIASNSSASHRLAMSQMRGGFSKELTDLRIRLLNFVSLIELELDFSEEEVEFADRKKLFSLVEEIETKIKSLADSFKVGNAIKNGIPVAIAGETNVGKSTLLNWLLNEDKAIVSDVHGTTRDVIEDTIQINGVLFRFIDTAGIRQTKDVVENLGIERTFQKISEAEIILLMLDATDELKKIEKFLQETNGRVAEKNVIVLFNKVDLISEEKKQQLEKIAMPESFEKIFISAKGNINKESLLMSLQRFSHLNELEEKSVVVTNLRHYEALKKALEAITEVHKGLESGVSGDFLSRDIRDCLFYLGDITGGEITSDEVLGNVFKNFCIGK